eukprot:8585833-Lingulodinium_polyedra.AAC.1
MQHTRSRSTVTRGSCGTRAATGSSAASSWRGAWHGSRRGGEAESASSASPRRAGSCGSAWTAGA